MLPQAALISYIGESVAYMHPLSYRSAELGVVHSVERVCMQEAMCMRVNMRVCLRRYSAVTM
jgi:hypothetical protein